MSVSKRISVELLAPSFLAVLWIAVDSLIRQSETIGVVVGAFFIMLFFAYFFSVIPSLIYTLIMEAWFRSGLRARFGLICTGALSSFLGAGAGFLACAIGIWLRPLIGENPRDYALRGAVAGLLVGLYVGRKQTSHAAPNKSV
jgi:hypothetical protein